MKQTNFFRLMSIPILMMLFSVNTWADAWSDRGYVKTNTTHRYFQILDAESQPVTKYITGTTFTFESWFYLDNMDQAKGRFFYINNGAQFGFTNDGNSLLIQNFGTGRTVDIWLAYKTLPEFSDLTAGKWIHMALVVDGNNWKVYLDGTVRYNQDRAGGYMTNTTNFLIGGDWWGNFQGKVAEVRVWNTARTAAEISTNMRKIVPIATSGLIGRINFAEGSGQSSNNFATVGGGAWAHAGGASISWGLVSKQPTNLQTPEINSTGFSLTWEAGTNETSYTVAVRPEGSTGAFTYFESNSKSCLVTGLVPGTSYDVKVMSSMPLESDYSNAISVSLTTTGVNNQLTPGVNIYSHDSYWQIVSENGANFNAMVYSLSGNLLGVYNNQNRVIIDNSEFSKGVYLVNINTPDGKSVFKVVK